jgi:NAD(P)-dependent dehydrogenase (short-subunit alcohol dehydrogenase family)
MLWCNATARVVRALHSPTNQVDGVNSTQHVAPKKMGDAMTRVAIVSGGAQGIGAAVAKRFLQDGFAGVVLIDRNAARLALEEKALSAFGAVAVLAADLRDDVTPDRAVKLALEKFGRVDVLVNAAGNTERCSVEDTSVDAYHRLFDINVKAPLFLMQKAAAAMQAGGAIINISSMLAYGGPPDIAIYAASKAALVVLSKNAANTLKGKGIRVNCINLGWANTEGEHDLQTGFHKQPENWAELAGKKVPFGKLITPEHIAGTCAYLVSPAAELMTGAVIDYEQMPVGTYDFHPMVKRD